MRSAIGMNNIRWLGLPGLLVIVGAILLSACDGGDGDADETTAPTASTAGTPPPSAPADAGSLEQLAAMYAAGVDGHVVYAIDSENYGTHPAGTWETYRLNGEVREDWASSPDGYEVKSVAIKANDGFYFCGGDPFTVFCREEQDEKALEVVWVILTPIKEFAPALLEGNVDYTYEELPDETIADTDAKCFDVTVNGRVGEGPAGTEKNKLCFSEDGALLSMDRHIDFEDPAFPEAWIKATAQEVEDAEETDFDLPVNPTTPPTQAP
jgi:hypothetical protein